jgi:hypothetical protein
MGSLGRAHVRQMDRGMAAIVDHHGRIAGVEVWWDKALRDPVNARLKIHRRLRPKPSENANCFHATFSGTTLHTSCYAQFHWEESIRDSVTGSERTSLSYKTSFI